MFTSDHLKFSPLDEEGFPRTHRALRDGVADGVAPGFVAGVWRASHPDQITVRAIGNRSTHPSAQPMTIDTIFDLASVSKIYATSTLAAILVDRGWIRWDTPLKNFFPTLPYSGVELRHLLSHTAGFPAWAPLWETLRDRLAPVPVYRVSIAARQALMRELVFKIGPERALNEKAVYSDISFLLLGFALEEATQMPLDHAIERFVWEPLGVRRSSYQRVTKSAAGERREAFAATEDSLWRGGILQGQVHDDNCWAMGGYGGHAGAFADVRDVLHYARRLFGGFISRRTLLDMWSRVSLPAGCERTLGWDTPSGPESSVGPHFSPRSVGHLGYTGTSFWIDPEAELAVALFSNRVLISRENIKIRAFRPTFHNAIREDLAGSDNPVG